MTVDPRRDDAATAVQHAVSVPALQREIAAREDETLFHAARRHGLRIVGACGGRGLCGTCVVRVVDGRVHRDGDDAQAEPGRASRRWLRACRVRARSDLQLEIAPRSLARVVRTDVEAGDDDGRLPCLPRIDSHALDVPAPTLDDPSADADRLLQALGRQAPWLKDVPIDVAALRAMPAVLREAQGRVDVRLCRRRAGHELVDVAPRGTPRLGLAVDLGTTNIAAFLVDLAAGRRLASLSVENPQAAFGADLISRIDDAARSPARARQLQAAVVEVLNALAGDLCRAVGATPRALIDAFVCGNSAMQHLLAGLPVAQLGRAPFVGAVRERFELAAREIGLDFAPGAALQFAPAVGGFVGGDHVAALLATRSRWDDAEATVLVLDIGTNTELSLVHRGAIVSASCPSGPALEGGHLGCGMRASEGAIERVELDAAGALRLQVIGAVAPLGLCGSGVIDAVAAFVRGGLADRRGRLQASAPQVVEQDGVRAVALADGVHFTQHDLRAVQLAKSAIRTGCELLLRERGLDAGALDRVVIAGAFGAYIDIGSAVAIGLLPALPPQRFERVGNAAGLGVQQMLASADAAQQASAIARRCRYVELSRRADFQPTFLRHLGF